MLSRVLKSIVIVVSFAIFTHIAVYCALFDGYVDSVKIKLDRTTILTSPTECVRTMVLGYGKASGKSTLLHYLQSTDVELDGAISIDLMPDITAGIGEVRLADVVIGDAKYMEFPHFDSDIPKIQAYYINSLWQQVLSGAIKFVFVIPYDCFRSNGTDAIDKLAALLKLIPNWRSLFSLESKCFGLVMNQANKRYKLSNAKSSLTKIIRIVGEDSEIGKFLTTIRDADSFSILRQGIVSDGHLRIPATQRQHLQDMLAGINPVDADQLDAGYILSDQNKSDLTDQIERYLRARTYEWKQALKINIATCELEDLEAIEINCDQLKTHLATDPSDNFRFLQDAFPLLCDETITTIIEQSSDDIIQLYRIICMRYLNLYFAEILSEKHNEIREIITAGDYDSARSMISMLTFTSLYDGTEIMEPVVDFLERFDQGAVLDECKSACEEKFNKFKEFIESLIRVLEREGISVTNTLEIIREVRTYLQGKKDSENALLRSMSTTLETRRSELAALAQRKTAMSSEIRSSVQQQTTCLTAIDTLSHQYNQNTTQLRRLNQTITTARRKILRLREKLATDIAASQTRISSIMGETPEIRERPTPPRALAILEPNMSALIMQQRQMGVLYRDVTLESIRSGIETLLSAGDATQLSTDLESVIQSIEVCSADFVQREPDEIKHIKRCKGHDFVYTSKWYEQKEEVRRKIYRSEFQGLPWTLQPGLYKAVDKETDVSLDKQALASFLQKSYDSQDYLLSETKADVSLDKQAFASFLQKSYDSQDYLLSETKYDVYAKQISKEKADAAKSSFETKAQKDPTVKQTSISTSVTEDTGKGNRSAVGAVYGGFFGILLAPLTLGASIPVGAAAVGAAVGGIGGACIDRYYAKGYYEHADGTSCGNYIDHPVTVKGSVFAYNSSDLLSLLKSMQTTLSQQMCAYEEALDSYMDSESRRTKSSEDIAGEEALQARMRSDAQTLIEAQETIVTQTQSAIDELRGRMSANAASISTLMCQLQTLNTQIVQLHVEKEIIANSHSAKQCEIYNLEFETMVISQRIAQIEESLTLLATMETQITRSRGLVRDLETERAHDHSAAQRVTESDGV